MANTCGHENVEMNGPDGHCTRCGRCVGSYDNDENEWRWFRGEDPSVYRVNLLAIKAASGDPVAKKALAEIVAQLRAAL